MWDEITNAFPNFNSASIEVWEWIDNFIPHIPDVMITNLCWDQIKSWSWNPMKTLFRLLALCDAKRMSMRKYFSLFLMHTCTIELYHMISCKFPLNEMHFKLCQTSNISYTLVGNKLLITQIKLEHCLSVLIQLHLHSGLNAWLLWIGQRQLQDEMRNIEVFGFGVL